MGFLAAYIMRGRMQAIMLASVSALLSLVFPPVSIVSSASVALVTLRRGAAEGWYILVCACLASALLGVFLMDSYQFPLLYGLVLWTPVWLISVVLREGRHLFLAIEIVIAIAAVAMVGAYLYQPNLAQVWENLFDPLLKPALINSNPELPVAAIQHSLSVFYRFIITGLVAQIYVSGLLAGLFLGRWWQAVLYNPGGFKKEYLNLQGQPELAIVTLVIVAAALLFSGLIAEICWNLSILLFVLYAFVGTIILHCAFATTKMKRFMIPFLYVTMMLIPYALIPVAIIGLTDTWLNLRNKIPNQTSV
jgi:hypothetical protein